LDGTPGLELSDDHIDRTTHFANGNTIVTHQCEDFIEPTKYNVLVDATNANGQRQKIVHLPITVNKIPEACEYGIYINYYAGNSVVILSKFNDPSDDVQRKSCVRSTQTRMLFRSTLLNSTPMVVWSTVLPCSSLS
jgi:agmatine deiminase